MSYYNIPEPSSDPKVFSGQIANIVKSRRELSHEDSIDLRRRIPQWYEQYRGYRKSKAQPFRNQVHIPLTFATIESDVAVKASMIAGQRPIVEYIPAGPEDAMSARKTTSLVDMQFTDCGFYGKLLDLLRSGDICGTAIVQWFWRRDENTRQQRIPGLTDPMTGRSIPQVINGTFVDFNGPDFEVIDPLDFYGEPSKARLDKMRWVIRRYWLDYDEIKRMAFEGTFDKAAVDELGFTSISDESSSELEQRRLNPGALFTSQNNPERFDKFSKPVEILEMHGLLPDEFVPDDGFNNRLITIANGKVVLRNVPNPIWAKGIPFAAYTPVPDPYHFWGIGKIEPNEKLQATASRFASQKLDALDIFIDPMFFYNRLANVDTRKMYTRAGGAVPVDGPPAEQIMPVFPDLRGLQLSYQEIESLWRWMQISTGVLEDTVIGQQSANSDRQTAREFLGRAESSQRRLVFETLMCVDQFVLPLAQAFRELNAQFMDFPTQIRMLGQAALIDPQTGMPIPPEPFVNLQDVILRYDMRAQATTSLVGKGAKQQNDVLLVPAIAQTPIAMALNWYAVARKLCLDFDWNPDELLVNPQQFMLNMMAAVQVQMAQQTKGAQDSRPAGGNGKAAGAPSGLILDMMSQFIKPEGSKPSGPQ